MKAMSTAQRMSRSSGTQKAFGSSPCQLRKPGRNASDLGNRGHYFGLLPCRRDPLSFLLTHCVPSSLLFCCCSLVLSFLLHCCHAHAHLSTLVLFTFTLVLISASTSLSLSLSARCSLALLVHRCQLACCLLEPLALDPLAGQLLAL